MARPRVVLWSLEVVDAGVADGKDLIELIVAADVAAPNDAVVEVTVDCGSEPSLTLNERLVRTIGRFIPSPKVDSLQQLDPSQQHHELPANSPTLHSSRKAAWLFISRKKARPS